MSLTQRAAELLIRDLLSFRPLAVGVDCRRHRRHSRTHCRRLPIGGLGGTMIEERGIRNTASKRTSHQPGLELSHPSMWYPISPRICMLCVTNCYPGYLVCRQLNRRRIFSCFPACMKMPEPRAPPSDQGRDSSLGAPLRFPSVPTKNTQQWKGYISQSDPREVDVGCSCTAEP